MVQLNERKRFYKRPFLWLLIFNVAFFILAAWLLPSRFEENDDVTMLLFSSGKYSGTPEAHLVFINYVYGLVLKFLYSWNDQIEWYSVLFAFFHIISISVLSWLILTSEKVSSVSKWLFFTMIYLFEVRFILLFQFTTTAALCALSGILLIRLKNGPQQIFGAILFIIGGMIRFEAALLVLMILSPSFLNNMLANKKLKFSRSLFFIAIALVLSFIFKYVDYQSYQQTEDWKYYQQYNKVRGKINDNPFVANFKNHLPTGITFSDFKLLYDFLPDGHVWDLEKLVIVKKGIQKVTLKQKLFHFIPALKPFYVILAIICICWFFLIITPSINKMNKLILGLSFFLFLSILFYISTFGFIKSRVFLPALFTFIFVLFISLEDSNKSDFKFFISICFFGIMFLKQDIFTWYSSKEYREKLFSQQKELVTQYFETGHKTLIPYNLSIQFYDPFSISNKFMAGQLYSSGWATRIPFNKMKFESYLDLINGYAIFLNKNAYSYICNMLKISIKTNYGIDVSPVIEFKSKDFVIARLVAK
jgi:hypothetical protein